MDSRILALASTTRSTKYIKSETNMKEQWTEILTRTSVKMEKIALRERITKKYIKLETNNHPWTDWLTGSRMKMKKVAMREE